MNIWVTSIVASLVWGRGEVSIVEGHLGQAAVGFYSVGPHYLWHSSTKPWHCLREPYGRKLRGLGITETEVS